MKLIRNISIVVLFFAVALSLPFILGNRDTGPWIDPYLASDVNSWQRDMESAKIDYRAGFNRISKIAFEEIELSHTGSYTTWGRIIIVSHRQAEKGPWSVKATLYHELGHAVFRLEHGSCAIMAKSSASEKEIKENWSNWLAEYLMVCKQKEFEGKY